MSYLIDLASGETVLFAFDAVPTMENVERDAPIAVGSIPEQKPLIRESQDRVVALARRRARGCCPGTARPPGRRSARSPVELR